MDTKIADEILSVLEIARPIPGTSHIPQATPEVADALRWLRARVAELEQVATVRLNELNREAGFTAMATDRADRAEKRVAELEAQLSRRQPTQEDHCFDMGGYCSWLTILRDTEQSEAALIQQRDDLQRRVAELEAENAKLTRDAR